jgi:hypothetical protein
VTRLSVVPPLPAQRTAEPSTGPEKYDDDDLRLVPVRLLLALDGRCSCDDCCRAWLAGDERAGVVEVSRPRLRVVGR